MKKILITGASGFLGSRIMMKMQKPGIVLLAPLRMTLNINDRDSVFNYIRTHRPHLTLHTAAVLTANESDSPGFRKTNVTGSINLLSALLEYCPGTGIILTSSTQIYGETPVCALESQPPSPMNHYAWSKMTMENEAQSFMSRLKIIVVRPANFIGPGQKPGFAPADLINKAIRENPVVIRGNPDSARDYIHIDDAAEAYALLAEKGVAGEIYNISSGRAIKITRLAKIIISALKMEKEIISEPCEGKPPVRNCANPAKMKALGWRPKISIEEAVKQMIDGCKNSPIHRQRGFGK